MIPQNNFGKTNGKHRPHCRLCGYGSRGVLYDYQVFRHIERVHSCPLGETEEWAILDRQQGGDDSRCFYHLNATTEAMPHE